MKALMITLILTGVAVAVLLQRTMPTAQEDNDAINPSLQP